MIQKTHKAFCIAILFLITLVHNIHAQKLQLNLSLDTIVHPTCGTSPNGRMVFQLSADSGYVTLHIKKNGITRDYWFEPFSIGGLSAGRYEIWATAEPFKNSTDTLIVHLSDSLIFQAQYELVSLPTCYYDSTYSFKINTSKGIPPYYFSVYPEPKIDTINTFSGLQYKRYFVRAKDQLGCVINLATPDTLMQPFEVYQKWMLPISCEGKMDGILDFEVQGGKAPYQLIWNEFPGYTEFQKHNLSSGWYNIFAIDSLGCQTPMKKTYLPIRYIINKIQFCSAGQKIGGNHIELKWTNIDLTAQKEIQIFRSKNFSGASNLIASISPVDTISYTDTAVLASDGPWYYGVRVLDSCGNVSGMSSITRACLGSATRNNEGVTLTWTPYLGRSGIKQHIKRKNSQGIWETLASVSPFTTQWIDNTAFSPGLREYIIAWEFKETCNPYFKENEVYSNIIKVDIPSGLTLMEPTELHLYPNPTVDLLYFQTSNTLENCSFTIRNMAGQLLVQGQLTDKNFIPIQELSAGVYLIEFCFKDGKHCIRQFVK